VNLNCTFYSRLFWNISRTMYRIRYYNWYKSFHVHTKYSTEVSPNKINEKYFSLGQFTSVFYFQFFLQGLHTIQ